MKLPYTITFIRVRGGIKLVMRGGINNVKKLENLITSADFEEVEKLFKTITLRNFQKKYFMLLMKIVVLPNIVL